MPIEQEPIKIEIPVEEDELVHLPERRRPGSLTSRRLRETGREVGAKARAALQSEKRRQAQAAARAGLRTGARASRIGLVRGLNWLSKKLDDLAERFTPIEKG